MASSSLFQVLIVCFIPIILGQHRLEPSDGSIMHCAGQTNSDFTDMDGFQGYSNYLNDSTLPEVFMIYLPLNQINDGWFPYLEQVLEAYGANQWLGVQLGLWFSGLCEEVASGQYDAQIQMLVSGMESTNRPYWIRIGYEFNGEWNDYNPPSAYQQAYQRITNAIRANTWANKYVATIWDYATDAQNLDYMEWYPGDSYVDWWGVNIFSGPSAPNSTLVTSFASDAASRGFPVLLGESTPRYTGVTGGQSSWDVWFQPYFYQLIFEKSYNIRGFCYINWNWATADGGRWSDWGDAQIQDNSIVGQNYQNALYKCGDMCFNADNQQNVLNRLGLS